MIVVLLFCISIQLVHCNKFALIASGHYPVSPDDVGIRFYLRVLNTATHRITVVKAHDPECCWTVEDGDVDCDSMQLFGGFPLTLDSGAKQNVSYVFSNIYPMDRYASIFS